MKLPTVSQPHRYRGLYIYDFGSWTALGYTAEEIAMLLESDAYRGGKVYKIIRTTPDGHMELRGVAPQCFHLESGMFFVREDFDLANADFTTLQQLGQATPPPCRAYVHLADRGRHEGVPRYVTALIYPAEYEEEISRWLLDTAYAGGDTVVGGPSHVSDYYALQAQVLKRQQLWSSATIPSRQAEEVLGSVRRAVQR